MVGSDVFLVLPGDETGWEVWRFGEKRSRQSGLERLGELPPSVKKVAIGLPARSCTTFAVALPRVEPAMLPEMAFAQIEKRGLGLGGRQETVYAHHVLRDSEEGLAVSVDVLPSDFSEDLCLRKAVRYTAAARFFRLPDQKLVLAREQGGYVMHAGIHGKLAFSQLMTAGNELTPAFAQEIILTLVSLEGSGLLPEMTGVEAWCNLPPQGEALLRELLPVPLTVAHRPRPERELAEEASGRMLPARVREEQKREEKKGRIRTGILALAAIYVLAGVVLTIHNQMQRRSADDLDALIGSRRDKVKFVQASITRQRALEPAYNKRFYPAVQLSSVARIMPPSGIVLQKFSTQGQTVRLEGLAREPQLAFQLKEDLEKAADFAGYSWDMAPPRMNQNNSAAFRLEGKYAGAN